ncbi:MAG: TlpA family protein disulfide reductase [Desulfovibrio sp.]|nr:TlpA family protein disulfide reductase [Desulfovibrio sp.]
MKKRVLFLILCLAFFAGTDALAKSLTTLQGRDLDALLAENNGKVVMVNFFATWCPPCRMEIPEVVKVSKQYHDKNVRFIGLSVDDPKSQKTVEKFVDTMHIDYPVYMAGQDLLTRFSIGSIPHNVFYDRKGSMVISQPGSCDADDIRYVVDELLHEE